MKRDLAQPLYGRVEHGSPIPGFDFASLMKGYFSLYLYKNYGGLYVVYMAMISLVFLSLLCWLSICFREATMYGCCLLFTCN